MAKGSITYQILDNHLVSGHLKEGNSVAIKIDQTLTQDATGTLVMMELEALGIDRIQTEVSAQYVDHNLIQADYKNSDDHIFLQTAAQKFGLHYSRPGNGVSHPLHMAKLGIPGKTMLGSDSHTCAAGSLGMLAIGVGGLDVTTAIMGEPFQMKVPKIWGIYLREKLPSWVSAKDIILELLRRHGVAGGKGQILEYHGPGVKTLSAMDRHVIANMGAELGATTSIFPSDEQTKLFLKRQNREKDWLEIQADESTKYDRYEEIDLSSLEPLIAKPQSPGNVVPVKDVEGEKIYQSYIGSSANPGYRDFAIAAQIVKGQRVPSHISFDINPTSREILENLISTGELNYLLAAGARLHQAGCNGCIGMGQAPATDHNSLRTTPRNFPGRSGTKEDKVWLCSPETAAASALRGEITDPRRLKMDYPVINYPKKWMINEEMIDAPIEKERAKGISIRRGPNISEMPELQPLKQQETVQVALKVGDDISTDTILPAGLKALPYRSNIPKISEFSYSNYDETYVSRVRKMQKSGGHIIVAGENYGQGSSREHAALALAYLGLRMVLAKSYSRIHFQNLINFGILPLEFSNLEDYAQIQPDDVFQAKDLLVFIKEHKPINLIRQSDEWQLGAKLNLSRHQVELLISGGLINWLGSKRKKAAS